MILHIAKVAYNRLTLIPKPTHVSTNKHSVWRGTIKINIDQASACINNWFIQILLVMHCLPNQIGRRNI